MIRIIAATGRDGAIGRRGDLAFHISADLRRFKTLTTGHTVVMGRRTFESLPKGALPRRRNIVVTRNPAFSAPGAECAPSLEAALAMAASPQTDTFIIGGGEIYSQSMPLADELLLTEVDAVCPGADTFCPAITPGAWVVTEDSGLLTDDESGRNDRCVCYGCKESVTWHSPRKRYDVGVQRIE